MKYMLRSLAIGCVMAATAWSAGPASAHHSSYMFDHNKTITISGVVKQFQYTNPHSWLIVEKKNPDGTLTAWGFEAEGPSTLMRAGIHKSDLKPGMKITISGHPMKDGRPAATWMTAKDDNGKVFNPRAGFKIK